MSPINNLTQLVASYSDRRLCINAVGSPDDQLHQTPPPCTWALGVSVTRCGGRRVSGRTGKARTRITWPRRWMALRTATSSSPCSSSQSSRRHRRITSSGGAPCAGVASDDHAAGIRCRLDLRLLRLPSALCCCCMSPQTSSPPCTPATCHTGDVHLFVGSFLKSI